MPLVRIIAGLSGGVDSAVAAALLRQQGHEVIGVTLRTWSAEDGSEGRCCEIDDARRVAWKLGIPYYPLSCYRDFEEHVTGPFVREYLRGRTPNPCIECNRYVKWERLLYYARVLRADAVATGHYASVVRLPNGRFTVRQAAHSEKDQTYMLCRLTQEQLKHTLMPLGTMSKTEVRKLAEYMDLPVADKPDSQELCFVPDGHYGRYVTEHAEGPVPGEGNFTDETGRILGRHRGIVHYTVGQRRGLGISSEVPLYVKKIDVGTNEIILAPETSLCCRTVILNRLNFLGIPPMGKDQSVSCRVKIRSHHEGADACVEMTGRDRAVVRFQEPVRAPAPGQSAVFYDADRCVIGSGIIVDPQIRL